jgi:uncharacterized protein YcbX
MTNITLSEINIYPVKSLAGISLENARIQERGLQFDRRWMIVDGNGKLLTQREFPKMALIQVSIESENLRVEANGMDVLQLPFAPQSNAKIEVQVWQDIVKAILCKENVNEWFSKFLNTNCRLVFMPDETRRAVELEYKVKSDDIVSFADAYPFLLISQSSLDNLNSQLEKPVPMNRFRPNFVINNTEAFAEDNWKEIKVGESVFHVVKPCARCVLTTVDQARGAFDVKEPLQTLATYRTKKTNGNNKVIFGQYLIAEDSVKTIRVNDNIQILK